MPVTVNIIWFFNIFISSLVIIVFSMGETSELGILAGLSILVAGGIAMAIPVQGGIGTYHAFITGILLLYLNRRFPLSYEEFLKIIDTQIDNILGLD